MKVAILGFGVEGRAAYDYFHRQGAEITIFDAATEPKQPLPEGVTFVGGPDYLTNLEGFDKVVRLPAINPRRIHTSAEVTSNTREFLQHCPTRKIVGVTATKGKGTICSLIAAMLRAAGERVHLAGNIGTPALEILPEVAADDVVVLELSSFQLWDVTTSPPVAVVGMIEPEHLEVHDDLSDYLNAKAGIAKYQTADDVVIFHPTNELSAQIAMQSPGRRARYNTPEGAYLHDGYIVVDNQPIVAIADVRLPGQHNLENICAAVTAAWQFTQDTAAMAAAIRDFKGLEHRLEFVAEQNGVKYYNDSISTTPGSVLAAVRAFEPAHELMIIGGTYDKGVDFHDMAVALAQANPKKIFFVGPMGQKIADLCQVAGYENGEIMVNWTMPQVVARAKAAAAPGDVVILSPATASFGDFTNYKERGQQFKDAVIAS